MTRRERGKGFASIEDCVDGSTQELLKYIKKKEQREKLCNTANNSNNKNNIRVNRKTKMARKTTLTIKKTNQGNLHMRSHGHGYTEET